MDVDAMLDSITERQFKTWMAYNRVHPISDDRFDVTNALGFTALCNIQGAKAKVEQFLPFIESQSEEADEQAEINKAREIAIKMGAVKG